MFASRFRGGRAREPNAGNRDFSSEKRRVRASRNYQKCFIDVKFLAPERIFRGENFFARAAKNFSRTTRAMVRSVISPLGMENFRRARGKDEAES